MAHIKRALSEAAPIELLNPGDRVKTAGALPAVQAFLDTLVPDPRYTYALCNAMGYSEFYGSNSNADWYGYCPELDFNGLLHAWPDIGVDLETDRMKGRDWPYGYPCFYNATVYAHHKNSDPVQLGFGDVRFAFANPEMKRVELLMRIHNEEARKKGHLNFVERIVAGERCDVSMGTRIPFDLCVHPTTLVRTPEGHVAAEDVEVGDLLLTHKGRYRRVSHVHRRASTGDALRLRTKGLPDIVLSEAHPMLVVRKEHIRTCKGSSNGERRRHTANPDGITCRHCEAMIVAEPVWAAASTLSVGDFLAAPRLPQGDQYISPEAARLLGYYIGDGWRVRERRGADRSGEHYLTGLGFSVGLHEPAHKERLLATIRQLAPKPEPRVYVEADGKQAEKIYVHDQGLAKLIVDLGGHGSRGKRLATEVFTWNRDSLLELLAGWIDTDGSYDVEKGCLRVCSVNRGLVLDFQKIAHILGIPATVVRTSTGTGYASKGDAAWFLFFGKGCLESLYDRCVKLSVAERLPFHPNGQAVILRDYVLQPIYAIEEAEADNWVNFSIEEDESFVIEGTASHNCSICSDWDAVKKAWKTFDPSRHKHPGIAILEYHKKVEPIRGLAVTKSDYCSCLRTQKNKILSDGRRVFMYNVFPRFFDISCVFIGADRTARVMWFLGSSYREDAPIKPDPVASVRNSLGSVLDLFKAAELEKEIPGGVLQVLGDADTAPPVRFDRLGADPKSILSSAAALGIILGPKEFGSLLGAQEFDTCCPSIDDSLSVSEKHVVPDLLLALSKLVPERSSFKPALEPRLKRPIEKTASIEIPEPTMEGQKIAAKYNGYRLSVLEKLGSLVDAATTSGYHERDPLDAKVAGSGLASLLLGAAPVVHLLASHLRRKQDEGQQIGAMASFIAENPTFVALAVLGAGIRTAMIADNGGLLSTAVRLLSTKV